MKIMNNKKLLSAFALVLILLVLGAGAAFGVGSLARRRDIGKTAAEQYAIADAGVDASGVFLKRTELEIEGGRAVYEVEFISGNREYDYTIDAASGKILYKDFDIEGFDMEGFDVGAAPAKSEVPQAQSTSETQSAQETVGMPKTQSSLQTQSASQPQVLETAASQPQMQPLPVQDPAIQESAQHIGVDRAKTIAVTQAGLTMEAVHFLKAKLDNDDGRYEYEIEFYHGNMEYEVSVDAVSGAVLEFSADND